MRTRSASARRGLAVLATFLSVFSIAPTWAQSVTLAWNPSPSPCPTAPGYMVFYGLNNGDYIFSGDAGTNTSFTVSGLTPGMTYYFAVSAYDSSEGESGFSNEVTNSVPLRKVGGGAATSFTATPAGGNLPLTAAVNEAGTAIVSTWHWDSGDGRKSNAGTPTNVVHDYPKAGLYTVMETVTGPGQNKLFKDGAGLDPSKTNSILFFSLASVPGHPGWMNLIFSPVVAGRTYTPLFSTDLLNARWAPLTTVTPPVTNGVQVTLTDTNAIQAQKFYRMEISVP